MTKVNFGGLKQKLLASIVAISAIQVLKAFMNIDTVFDTQKLAWLVGVHLVFVVSAFMLALSDRWGGERSRRRIASCPRCASVVILMVRSAVSRVSNHEAAPEPASILRDTRNRALLRMRTVSP